MAKGKSTRKKLAWVLISLFIVLPLLLCGGLIGAFIASESRAHAELEERKQALFDEGLPVDDLSMQAYYDSLTDDSLTTEWESVFAVLESESFEQPNVTGLPFLGPVDPPPTPPAKWDTIDEARTFLDQHRSVLEKLHSITDSNSSVRFSRQFDSLNTLLPEVQTLRTASRLLALEHAVALHDGDVASQAETIHSQLGCALAIRQDPLIISHLVSIALHGMALGSIQQTLSTESLTQPQLEQLHARLALFDDYLPVFRRSFDGERYSFLSLIENPSTVLENIDGSGSGGSALGLFPMSADSLFYLDHIDRIQNIEPTSIEDFARQNEQIDDDLMVSLDEYGILSRFNHVLSSLMLPAISAISQATCRLALSNRIAKLAIQIRLFEIEQGALPESLDELRASDNGYEVPVSANGGDFGYRKTASGAVLWGYATGEQRWTVDQSIPTEPPAADSEAATESPLWYWNLQSASGETPDAAN